MADKRLFGGTGEFPDNTTGYTTQRRNADGLPLGAELAVDFTPVVGDIKAGIETADYLNKGEYLNAALSGVGILPFIPSLMGVMRGPTKNLFHGSGENLTGLSDFHNPSTNLYGQGFYTTENIELAKRYAVRRDDNGNLYRVEQPNEINFLEMDKPMTIKVKEAIKKGVGKKYLKDFGIDEFIDETENLSTRSFYDTFREYTSGRLSADDVQNVFDDITDELKKLGYQGLELKDKTIKNPNIKSDIRVYWQPSTDVTFEKLSPDVIKPTFQDSLKYPQTDKVYRQFDLSGNDVAKWKNENLVKQRKTQVPELAAASKQLEAGKLTQDEYRKLVKDYLPIQPITKMPKMPTQKEIALALTPDKVNKGIVGVNKTIKNGTRVASRLDIPAYDNYDTWVVSLHDGSVRSGNSLGYGQTAVLKNVEFDSPPKGALKIATEQVNKSPIARIYGDWSNESSSSVYSKATKLLEESKKPGSDWVQVGMNPFRASYFYDKVTGLPVTNADEVIQVGPLVLAKNAKTASPNDPKFSIKPSDTTAPTFAIGGGAVALRSQEEQDDDIYTNPLLKDPFDYATP